MSTDAFAAALGKGASLHKPRFIEALRTGLIFGAIETITPVIGWGIGQVAARFAESWDHWIAFTLLLVLGLHMIYNGLKHDDEEEQKNLAHILSGFWQSPPSPPVSMHWRSAWAWRLSTSISWSLRWPSAWPPP